MKIILFLLLSICVACVNLEQYLEGKKLYQKHCSGCHGINGEGLQALIPPLAGAEMFLTAGPDAACWIVKGLEGKIIVKGIEYENAMPALKALSPIEIANILNYTLNSWGNKYKFISPEEISKTIKNCP
jgi:mono/diheme cytochrome c family protein